MSLAHALQPSPFALRVTGGINAGTVYSLQIGSISIGRSPDNTIVLNNDPKVSRHHVRIDVSPFDLKVYDISEKNQILIDNTPCKEATLSYGNSLKVGDTEFELINAELDTSAQVVSESISKSQNSFTPVAPAQFTSAQNSQASWIPNPQNNTGASTAQAPQKPKDQSKRIRFYLIVSCVAGLLWFLLSPSKKKNNEIRVRTSEEIMKETEASRARQKAIEEAQQKNGTDTRQYDEAQASYVRCFRDYRQGQYTRAIQHCQAALSLFPQHKLAERYLSIATRKRDERIQYLLSEGRLLRQRGFYKMCMSNLKTVMYELRDPKNIMFTEARQLYSECRALAEDRY